MQVSLCGFTASCMKLSALKTYGLDRIYIKFYYRSRLLSVFCIIRVPKNTGFSPIRRYLHADDRFL